MMPNLHSYATHCPKCNGVIMRGARAGLFCSVCGWEIRRKHTYYSMVRGRKTKKGDIKKKNENTKDLSSYLKITNLDWKKIKRRKIWI
jgi:uncharacterized Zn finger protein (UPF0148 family)